MGVHEGAQHLPAQLRSLAAQTHTAWRLVASDDSPGQASRAALSRFADAGPRPVEIRTGPRQGFAANFMSLIRALPQDPGPVAFADQDDVWFDGKLARALDALNAVPPGVPTLYCARSFYWDGAARRRPSPRYRRAPAFRNALIENIAQGNTIVLNPAGAALARRAAQKAPAVFAQDWWLYLLITGAGGHVHFDAGPPVMLYRQHAGNAIGSGQGLSAQTRRKRAVLAGAFAARLALNIAALNACRDVLTPRARAQLDQFAAARDRPLPARLAGLARLAPYRQSPAGTLGFWGAALLGRI